MLLIMGNWANGIHKVKVSEPGRDKSLRRVCDGGDLGRLHADVW